jgi:hypothetical protein
MAKVNWAKDRERSMMRGPCEAAEPKEDDDNRVWFEKKFPHAPPPPRVWIPPAPLPSWMKDRALLPKKPPRKGDPNP